MRLKFPAATKRRLDLEDQRSWIVVTESNRFTWPGPDLRRTIPGNQTSIAFGLLPKALFDEVRTKWLALFAARKTQFVPRTE
jgi:hypothetical protein